MMSVIDSLISIARKEIGYKEGVNNDNKYGVWFGMNHVSWCAIFICWVFAQGGAGSKLLKSASVLEIEAWAIKNKLTVPVSQIQVGDLLCHDFTNSGHSEHIDMATSAVDFKTHTLTTIGGNTSSGIGSQSNGDGVYEKHRPIASIRTVIRPKL